MKLSARLVFTLIFCALALPFIIKHFGLTGVTQQKDIKETYERENAKIEGNISNYKEQLLASVDQMPLEDEAFKKCVIGNISKYFGISDSSGHIQSAADLKHLECHRQGITSVAGIEAFTKLESISLSDNDVQDASPLANVDSLQRIGLGHGNKNIANIDELAQLNNLTSITFPTLKDTPCSDIDRVVQSMEDNSDKKIKHNAKSTRCIAE